MKIVITFLLLVFHLISNLFAQNEFVESGKSYIVNTQYSIRPIDLRSGDHWYYRDYTVGLGYVWHDKFSAGINFGQILKDPNGPFKVDAPAATTIEPYVIVELFQIDLSQSGDRSDVIYVTGNFNYHYSNYRDRDTFAINPTAIAKTIGMSFYKPFKINNKVSFAPKITLNMIFNSIQSTWIDYYPEKRSTRQFAEGRKLQFELSSGFGIKLSESLTLGIRPKIQFTLPIDAPGFGLPNEENATYSLGLIGVLH